MLGQGFALAGLGRYDEALERKSRDFRVQAFLLSRVGRYHEADEVLAQGQRELTQARDADNAASALLTSSWLLLERRQFAPARKDVRGAEMLVGETAREPNSSLLVLAHLIGGLIEISDGNVPDAVSRLAAQNPATTATSGSKPTGLRRWKAKLR